MKDLKELTRPNIWALKPYSSARDEYNGAEASVFLDANENPYNTPNNRYPDPMQRASIFPGACAAHYFFGDFCARDLYFGQGAGIASKRYGFLIYFFEKIFIIKEQVASVIPVPTTPCHPNQCQNIPARSVPMEPPIK